MAERTLADLAPCPVRPTGPGEDQTVPTLDEAAVYAAGAGRQALTDVWRAGADGVFTDVPAEARAVYHP